MRFVFPMMIAATLVSTALVPALAQSTSADDIIKALKPTGTIGSGTRGIRPASGQTPPPAVPAAPSSTATSIPAPASVPAPRSTATAAAAQPRPAPAPVPANAPSVNIEVQFATDSAELTPAARASLDQLGRALTSSDLAGYRFRIEGHTDTVGSPDHNRSLSARRADAVVDYLASTYKVDRARLQPVGLGSDNLAVPTGPQVAEPRNRRVQVINLGA